MMRRLVDHETYVDVSLNTSETSKQLTSRFVLVPVPSSEVVGTMNGVLKEYQLVMDERLLSQLTKSHSKWTDLTFPMAPEATTSSTFQWTGLYR
jgi:hypothetical protein